MISFRLIANLYNNAFIKRALCKWILWDKQRAICWSASVAQLEARPTGDQAVASSTPPGRQHSFVEIDHEINIFHGHSLPSADSRKAVVSFWRKNVHNTG